MQPSTADIPATRFSLTVPHGLQALEPARLAVHGFLGGRVRSDKALYRLDLVLEESLMNRMWHAHALGEGKSTHVQVDLSEGALVLRFQDDGVPFDPTQAPEAPVAEQLADAPTGGRGLMLTRKAAKQWSYERVDGRNVFTVVLATN